MKNGWLGEVINGCSYMVAVTQDNEVFRIIELVCSIVASIVLIAFRFWRWWKVSHEDGKVTKEEIDEGIKIVEEGIEDIKKNGK